MNSWLLPDGINESLPNDAEKLEALRRQLVDLYATWGYRLVMPPMVEYLESLRAGMGTQLNLQTFKVTDQTNGRTMGVRADITPQVARMDAHRLSDVDNPNVINRLCYIGSVLRTRSAQQGGSRSPVQVGAEVFGHAGIESDFEILSLMIETFSAIDIDDLVLDLGHVGVVNGVMNKIRLSESQQHEYVDMLGRKSLPEIEAWLENQSFSTSDSEMLRELPLLCGAPNIISSAQKVLKNAGQSVLDALQHLDEISQLINTHFPSLSLHIDVTEMRGYAYHTGIIYTVYLPGRGESIAHGGRYDGIGKAFGNNRPAIGFSTDLRTLSSLIADKKDTKNNILAPSEMNKELDQLIQKLRANGETVIRQLNTDNSAGITGQQRCDRIILKQDNGWKVTTI